MFHPLKKSEKNDHPPPGHSEESGKVGGVGGAGENTKEPPGSDQEELGDKMFQMSQKLKYALDSNSFDFAHLHLLLRHLGQVVTR